MSNLPTDWPTAIVSIVFTILGFVGMHLFIRWLQKKLKKRKKNKE
ncbi:MAG: hypothetical protein ABIH25_01255 [Candidatus Woesearchaeota archaeon]